MLRNSFKLASDKFGLIAFTEGQMHLCQNAV